MLNPVDFCSSLVRRWRQLEWGFGRGWLLLVVGGVKTSGGKLRIPTVLIQYPEITRLTRQGGATSRSFQEGL